MVTSKRRHQRKVTFLLPQGEETKGVSYQEIVSVFVRDTKLPLDTPTLINYTWSNVSVRIVGSYVVEKETY